MQIDSKVVNTKTELLDIIKEGVNPLEYIKEEKDIDFICNSLVITGNEEDTFFEESAENLLRAILYYLIYTENETKTIDRCKEIVKMGLDEETARDSIKNLLKKEERANMLYVAIDIASDKTFKAIFEKLNERLENIN